MLRTWLCLLCACCLLTVLAGCTTGQPTPIPAPNDTVTIVSSLPSRGATAGQTKAMSDAIRLAITERGGLAGETRVQYVPLEGGDDETGDWSRERELANAMQAAADPAIVAYIGPYTSGAAMVSLPVTNRAGLLEASPSVTWPGLTLAGWDPGEPDRYFPGGQRTFIRMMPPDAVQADAAVQWAVALGLTKVALLEDGSSYSAGLANEFAAAATRAGLTTVGRSKIDPHATGSLASEAGTADAIFYAPSSASNAGAVALALAGSNVTIFSTDTALDPQFIDQAGAAARNWRIISNSSRPDATGGYASAGPSSQVFPSQFAANAYDLTNLILDGVATGTGRDRAALITYLFNATKLSGALAQRIFTSTGDPASWALTGYTWDNGKFTLARSFASPP